MRPLIVLMMLLFCPLFGAEEAKPLPADAQAAITAYEKAVAKEQTTLLAKLVKAQEAATKKGDLDAALAIKAKIESMPKAPEEAKPVVAAPSPFETKDGLDGSYSYRIGATHTGQLTIKRNSAVDVLPGINGSLVREKDRATIMWGNNTQWILMWEGGVITVQASDGTGTLTRVSK